MAAGLILQRCRTGNVFMGSGPSEVCRMTELLTIPACATDPVAVLSNGKIILMKRLLWAILPGLAVFLGCHKNNSSSSQSDFYGQWKWVRTTSFFGPNAYDTIVPPVNTPIILFLNSDNSYSSTVSGVGQPGGTFRIKVLSSPPFTSAYYSNDVFLLSKDSLITGAGLSIYSGNFVNVSPDSLWIFSGLNPGGFFTTTFARAD